MMTEAKIRHMAEAKRKAEALPMSATRAHAILVLGEALSEPARSAATQALVRGEAVTDALGRVWQPAPHVAEQHQLTVLNPVNGREVSVREASYAIIDTMADAAVAVLAFGRAPRGCVVSITDPRFTRWLDKADACSDARDWLATLPSATVVPEAVAACPRGEWLLWAAWKAGITIPEAAYRPAVLRALRTYVPAASNAAGLAEHAAALRGLPDDVPCAQAADAAAQAAVWTAARAAAGAAVWAADTAEWAARAAEASGHGAAAERALCADDVRAAMPNLAAALVQAVEGGS
jgi:hypothetical protein